MVKEVPLGESPTDATQRLVEEKPVSPRTVTIEGTVVPIDPATNRPQPGTILGQGQPGAHKIPWTPRDVLDKFPMVDWFNYGDLRSVTFNGVRIDFGYGKVRTPSVARDLAEQSYEARGVADATLQRSGVTIATGQLEPRRP